MNNADWFGQLPEGWKVVKLKRAVTCNDESLSIKTPADTIIDYVEIGDVKYGQGIVGSTKYRFAEAPSRARRIARKGDVVLSTVRTYLKSVAFIEQDGRIFSTGFAVLRAKNVLPQYLAYVVTSNGFLDMVQQLSTGINYPTISQTSLLNIPIPLPPLEDQHRISRWLDARTKALDALVRSNARRVSALRELRQAEVARCVTRGLDPMARMVKCGNDWVDELPEGWRVVKLKRLGAMNKGLSITKANLVAEGEPVISYGQIHAKFNTGTAIDDTLIRHVPKAITSTAARSLACKGDFIFADTSEDMAGCGNAVFVDGEREVYGGYHTIVLHTGNNGSKYLAYLFRSDEWRHQIRTRVGGIKVYSITQTVLSQCEVILPPLAEQYRIATHLDKYTRAVDRLVANLQRQNELLGELRRRLIADAVLGRIPVTD